MERGNNQYMPDSTSDADDWRTRANCRGADPELFFPGDKKHGFSPATAEIKAKEYCQSCRVRKECLEYAQSSSERFGIWGGLNERERRVKKRK